MGKVSCEGGLTGMVEPSVCGNEPVVLTRLATQLNGIHPVTVGGVVVAVEATLHIAGKGSAVFVAIAIIGIYLTDGAQHQVSDVCMNGLHTAPEIQFVAVVETVCQVEGGHVRLRKSVICQITCFRQSVFRVYICIGVKVGQVLIMSQVKIVKLLHTAIAHKDKWTIVLGKAHGTHIIIGERGTSFAVSECFRQGCFVELYAFLQVTHVKVVGTTVEILVGVKVESPSIA